MGALFAAIPYSAVTYTIYGLFQPQDVAHVVLWEVYRSVVVLVLA